MTNYKVMPEVPTDEMIKAAEKSWAEKPITTIKEGFLEEYLAIYAAAPSVECEPVGEISSNGMAWFYSKDIAPKYGTKLYTIPPDAQAKITELEERLKVAEDALESLSYQSEDILNTSQSVMISANYVKKIVDEALNKIRGE